MSDDRIDEVEERQLILRDKAAREGFDIPEEVLDYIADKYALPQTLKGALINVQAYASRRGMPVTLDVARLVLDGIRPAAVVVEVPERGEVVEHEATDDSPSTPEPVTEAAQDLAAGEQLTSDAVSSSLEDALSAVLGATVVASVDDVVSVPNGTLFEEPQVPVPAPSPAPVHEVSLPPAPVPGPAPAFVTPPAPKPAAALVWFAPVRTTKKESLVARAGRLLQRAGLENTIDDGDLVAVKLHFGEEGNTGFVSPVFLREVVRLVREAGGKPFLTDSNTLYRGKRANAVDHMGCAVRNGFSFATVEAPIVIADGLDGRDAVDVPISGYAHFDSVRIGSTAAHADALVVVTHFKGHEATGFGGALKNVGMGLGCRSAKQRMHSDLKPQVGAEKCTACGKCVSWCPVDAIAITPDRIARIDYERCYGCGECVAACPYAAIAIQWKTEPGAIQEKIVEHVAGAVSGKDGKVIYLSFVMNVSPDCDCWHFSDASIVSDVGILASTDIVAIDQAAFDLVQRAAGLPGTQGDGLESGTDKFAAVTGIDGTIGLAYAEAHGLGTRNYELRTLD
ncbi:MAG: DUF362 domain-containing protein [Coriobacteriia bacterium]|nr:DUF362 domain-containing protein [Coriobacteriia bacterium]